MTDDPPDTQRSPISEATDQRRRTARRIVAQLRAERQWLTSEEEMERIVYDELMREADVR